MKRVLPVLMVVTLALHAAPAEKDVAELAKVFKTLQNVLDLAVEVERYAAEHGKLPQAKSPADLSRLVLGTDSAAEFFVDGWGTPLRLDSDPARGSYTISAAGGGHAFEFRNGQWVRSPEEWAMSRLKASGFDKVQALGSTLETSKAARTAADMMALHTAISAKTPAPAKDDAWGTPLAVKVVEASNLVRIVSAGSDGKLNADRWEETTKTTDYTRDLVLVNGKFTGEWDVRPAAEELARAYSGYEVFKIRLASVRTLTPEQRASMRAEGAAKEIEAALDEGDWRTALARFEDARKLNPQFGNVKLLRRLAGPFLIVEPIPVPGAAPEPPRPTVRTDPAMRAAAARIAQLLGEAAPEDWDTVTTLILLQRDLGDEAQSMATLDRFLRAHPDELRAHDFRLSMMWGKYPLETVIASLDTAKKVLGSQTMAATQLALTAFMKTRGADDMPRPTYTAIRQRAYDIVRRATEIDAGNELAWLSLGIIARQFVIDDPDSAKASEYQEEADRARARAAELRGKR